MSEYVLDALSEELSQQAHASRRQRHSTDDTLVLSELRSSAVVDHLDDDDAPVELITFGTLRETCPNCGHAHLKLVLRQRAVRVAHLFCAECQGCFDARYSNGAPALTI
ncbi:hypothetical protein F2P44_27995 [Massilia sp. CCM 8695]|uniref:Uncharacterized protein n=1 Tax=Massilia frigida TaxID=2609281 RepID=A0ABX0NCR1_9BURK|nr:hypothetical protein [Massilia frigida]NHZ83088.1 hypothetical protein [Massilia frigida]